MISVFEIEYLIKNQLRKDRVYFGFQSQRDIAHNNREGMGVEV